MNFTTKQLDKYFKEILNIENFSGDPSQNGLQVDNDGAPVKKVAFAVDASMETFKRAKESGADMVFVHHGLLWGISQPLTGIYYQRIKFLMENNIALYACHLPLDAHPELGNNASIAKKLELIETEPFCSWRGYLIGVKGRLPEEMTPEEILQKAFPGRKTVQGLFKFGKEKNLTVGIVSGGAAEDVYQAIDQGLDIYITGESSHEIYHPCQENKINFLAAGHYETETGGVKNAAAKLGLDTGIETVFIDIPTNQ